ncbi:MAG: hypothetical protein ACLQU9_20165 [Acidimicrobiales bacterium]
MSGEHDELGTLERAGDRTVLRYRRRLAHPQLKVPEPDGSGCILRLRVTFPEYGKAARAALRRAPRPRGVGHRAARGVGARPRRGRRRNVIGRARR